MVGSLCLHMSLVNFSKCFPSKVSRKWKYQVMGFGYSEYFEVAKMAILINTLPATCESFHFLAFFSVLDIIKSFKCSQFGE